MKTTATNTYSCEICGQDSFANAWGLKVHYSRMHKKEPLPEWFKDIPPRQLNPKRRKKTLNLKINDQVIDIRGREELINKERILPENFNCCPNCGNNISEIIALIRVAERMKNES